MLCRAPLPGWQRGFAKGLATGRSLGLRTDLGQIRVGSRVADGGRRLRFGCVVGLRLEGDADVWGTDDRCNGESTASSAPGLRASVEGDRFGFGVQRGGVRGEDESGLNGYLGCCSVRGQVGVPGPVQIP